MKYPVLFAVVIHFSLAALPAFSQQEDSTKLQHFISLQFGLNQVKEENLHPKVSSGSITELSYGFERRNIRYSEFEFRLGYSRMKTDLEDLAATANFKVTFNYSYNFTVFKKNNLTYYIGPKGVLAYSLCYFPYWDDSHAYWADYFSLNVNNVVSLGLKNEKEWLTALSFPLISLYSRPDLIRLYKIDDSDPGGVAKNLNSDIRAGFWKNAFQLHLESAIRFPAFKNKRESFFYAFDWARIKKNDGHPSSQLSHQFGIRLWL